MNRIDFDKIMRSRRRRQGRRDDSRAAVCPHNRPPADGPFGAIIPAADVLTFARCVTFYGGEWCASTIAFKDTSYVFLATVDFCGGPPCATDHRKGGRELLSDLEKFLIHCPRSTRVLHSIGWPHAGYRRRHAG